MVAGTIAGGVETFSGDAVTCRDASGAAAGTLVSFIGVRMAVNAISPFAGGAIDGAGAGSCGVLVTVALVMLGAGEDCVAAGVVAIAGIGTGATSAVKVAISATLLNCFFASAAGGRAAVGAGEALGVARLLKIDPIAESSTCANCGCPAATTGKGFVGAVEEAATLPKMDWIIELAICADVAGVVTCAGVGAALVDADDTPPNIDLIIESASCAGDAVVTGPCAVLIGISAGV